MSIDTRLMQKAIRSCSTLTGEVIKEFEEKYKGYASTTEEAAGLAILLSEMQRLHTAAFIVGARADKDAVDELVDRESYRAARDVCAYLVRPNYENRGFRGVLSFIFGAWHEFPLTNDRERLRGYNEKEIGLKRRLEELYWRVADDTKRI